MNYFLLDETMCQCGCGINNVDDDALRIMNRIRATMNRPVRLTSCCRCPKRNSEVGGVPDSEHLTTHDIKCKGFDVYIPNSVYRMDLIKACLEHKVNRIGIYLSNCVHIGFSQALPQGVMWVLK